VTTLPKPILTDAPPGSSSKMIADIYDELRSLAAAYASREKHRPAPTSLVHEALLRVGDLDAFESPAHLFAAMASSIRRSLVDRARRRGAFKRGDGWRRVPLDLALPAREVCSILDLDELLTRLASQDARCARVVELRIFGGLDLVHIAQVLGVSRKTITEDWSFSRAWLAAQLDCQLGARL
jgi:RNA polymerase sigma factor (TIGR02999 family)